MGSEKTRRAQLTEDLPTSGLHPTETSRPIQEREEPRKSNGQGVQEGATKTDTNGRRVIQG